MNAFRNTVKHYLLLALSASVLLSGCQCCKNSMPTPPLGTHSDPIWRHQEAGGEATDMTVYQHEFELDGARMNPAGQDHLRAIAARLHCGVTLPVTVERSATSIDPQSEYKYPVNPNSELDLRRREMVVQMLGHMGISNADNCVVVAPAIAEGATAIEASGAYQRGVLESNYNNQGNAGNYGGGAAFGAGFGAGTGLF
jgi:hypothetical protein